MVHRARQTNKSLFLAIIEPDSEVYRMLMKPPLGMDLGSLRMLRGPSG